MDLITPYQLPFFFIIGRPRSGTTLLRTLLDAHPMVVVPPEYPVIPDLVKRFGLHPHWTPALKGELLRLYREPLTFDFWKYEYLRIHEAGLQQAIENLPVNATMYDVIRMFCFYSRSVFPKEEVKLLGDKNPVYALHTPRLMKWFPEARFLFILRDYRDNFVSMKKFDWEAPHVVLQTWRWKYIARMMYRLQEQAPNRIYILRYEDLVMSPGEEFPRICRFLGIPHTDSVFQFHNYSQESLSFIDPATLNHYHESLTKPIHTDTIGRWKHQMSEKEVALAGYVSGRWGKRAGYFTDSNKEIDWRSAAATLPMRLYGACLYHLMRIGEYLPWGLRKRLGRFLPYLSFLYHKIFK